MQINPRDVEIAKTNKIQQLLAKKIGENDTALGIGSPVYQNSPLINIKNLNP